VADEFLRVVTIPDLDRRPVVRGSRATIGPLFFSYGQVNLLCGECSFLLIKGILRSAALMDAVIECPSCGAYNETWEAAAQFR